LGGDGGGDGVENCWVTSGEGVTVSMVTPRVDERLVEELPDRVSRAAWAVFALSEMIVDSTLTALVESCRREVVVSVMLSRTSPTLTPNMVATFC
tara:strand:- start:215 stop:499 length:285 start_codon:yes stop_codon:yes gene_type:complete